MHLRDLKNNVKFSQLLAASAITATANGTAVDLGTDNLDAIAILSCGTVSGTNPTMDVHIEDSADNSTFADVTSASFTQLTAAGSEVIRVKNLRRYVRHVHTIGGTDTPTFTQSVTLVSTAQILPAT